MNFVLLLQALAAMIGIAKQVVPVIAAQRKAADPTVSNAALSNVAKVVDGVTPLVAAAEQLSAAHVAAGGQALSGADKLAVVQSAVAQAHAVVTAAGGTTQSFDQVWEPASAAITLLCAVNAPPAAVTDPAATASA